MNYDQPPVLTSPEEIKDVMKEITGLKNQLENLLNTPVEKGKEDDQKVNIKYSVQHIIDFCNEKNIGDEFGTYLSKLAEAYTNLKNQLFQLNNDKLKIQLSRMESGTAAEGLKEYIKKNNVELN